MKIDAKKLFIIGVIIISVYLAYPKLTELRRENIQKNIEAQLAQERRDDMMKRFMGGQKVIQLKKYDYGSKIMAVKGVKNPHGVFELNGQIYVSSEADKELYKVVKGELVKFASLNFVHDMVALPNGSILATVFNEGRVVSISKSGEIKTVMENLEGPNGIALAPGKSFVVTNYFNGTVVSAKLDGTEKMVIINDMQGPAGVAINKKDNTIYVADYIESSVVVLNGNKVAKISFPGLVIESLFYENDRLYATAGLRTPKGIRGSVVELRANGQIKLVIDTGLPSPIVGFLNDKKIIHLISPNDPNGYVLRYPLEVAK